MALNQLSFLVDKAKKEYPSSLKFLMCCSAAFVSETSEINYVTKTI
uniref:Uncharacterized protein n=1 Tax=Schistosoma japonicum TaxID=6182 RepID=Q5C1F0_SCHJA|nr:unknown [Schistosoma japonicum]